MKQKGFKKILLRGAFSMMACDGEIHETEIQEIKQLGESSPYFADIDYEAELNSAINQLKKDGIKSIEHFLEELKNTNLSEKQELVIIEVLIKIVEADRKVEPSELKFLQMVKVNLKIDEETLITKFPTHIDYLLDMKHFGANISFEENIEALNFEALDNIE